MEASRTRIPPPEQLDLHGRLHFILGKGFLFWGCGVAALWTVAVFYACWTIVERIPAEENLTFEQWLGVLGAPLAGVAFVAFPLQTTTRATRIWRASVRYWKDRPRGSNPIAPTAHGTGPLLGWSWLAGITLLSGAAFALLLAAGAFVSVAPWPPTLERLAHLAFYCWPFLGVAGLIAARRSIASEFA